jgi:DNA-binding PadR family transcriptional regulator
MNPLDYHVLLALSGGALYGYAIKEAVAADSGGAQTPRAGTLYRVIARLITLGWVRETRPESAVDPHPGLARRYYGLTPAGRQALAVEARRLKSAAALAERRLGTAR